MSCRAFVTSPSISPQHCVVGPTSLIRVATHIIVYAPATATSGLDGGDAVEMPLNFVALNWIGMNLPAVTTSIGAISCGRMIEFGGDRRHR